MFNKIRQDLHTQGIEILGNELRLNQYADLFCADLATVEKALEIVDNFSSPPGCLQPSKSLVHLTFTLRQTEAQQLRYVFLLFPSRPSSHRQSSLYYLSADYGLNWLREWNTKQEHASTCFSVEVLKWCVTLKQGLNGASFSSVTCKEIKLAHQSLF